MIKDIYSEAAAPGAMDIVMSLIKSINEEDFENARKYADENMEFTGVLGTRKGAAAYFNDMEKMKLKYEVIKAFEDENDVCLLYNLTMSGKIIFGCGWYHLEENKITSLKVIFDPRPILEQQEKK